MAAVLLRALKRACPEAAAGEGAPLPLRSPAALPDAAAAALAALVEASPPNQGRAAMVPVFTSGALAAATARSRRFRQTLLAAQHLPPYPGSYQCGAEARRSSLTMGTISFRKHAWSVLTAATRAQLWSTTGAQLWSTRGGQL